MRKKKKGVSYSFGKYITTIFLLVPMATFVMPSLSFGLNIFQTADDAILFAEMCPNVAFQNFGLDKVTNVSRVNT